MEEWNEDHCRLGGLTSRPSLQRSLVRRHQLAEAVCFSCNKHSRSLQQPNWSKAEQKKKAKSKRVVSEDDVSNSEPARAVRLQVRLHQYCGYGCLTKDVMIWWTGQEEDQVEPYEREEGE